MTRSTPAGDGQSASGRRTHVAWFLASAAAGVVSALAAAGAPVRNSAAGPGVVVAGPSGGPDRGDEREAPEFAASDIDDRRAGSRGGAPAIEDISRTEFVRTEDGLEWRNLPVRSGTVWSQFVSLMLAKYRTPGRLPATVRIVGRIDSDRRSADAIVDAQRGVLHLAVGTAYGHRDIEEVELVLHAAVADGAFGCAAGAASGDGGVAGKSSARIVRLRELAASAAAVWRAGSPVSTRDPRFALVAAFHMRGVRPLSSDTPAWWTPELIADVRRLGGADLETAHEAVDGFDPDARHPLLLRSTFAHLRFLRSPE